MNSRVNIRLNIKESIGNYTGHYTVAEVAAMVGYSNLGHFAAAFKRKFGITPRDDLWGKKLL
ncbi:helix-turn-helix domain-containing protein [Leptolyngbya sp. 7M]|uniref:helix-turn-helix domain-containing protein n=1 Tax=Leptolyngbya sp. 7M TaxID=2812896 RepID=UPI0021F0AFEC|nr:helix-turn-helix domain-containing protein [Leptolyngbya sp. 7M]